jgi:predicted DNA-binding protein
MRLNLTRLDEPTRSYSLPLYESVKQKLEKVSAQTGVSVAKLVRHSINDFLDQYED